MKITKRKIAIFLVLSLLLMIFTIGCGAPTDNDNDNNGHDIQQNGDAQADNNDQTNKLVGEKVMSIAATASLLLNGEYGDMHEQIVEDGNRDGDAYKKLFDILGKIRDINKSTYVYTLIKIDDKITHLIVDAANEDDADEYGAEYEMEPQFEKAFAGEPAYAIHTWEDETYGIQKSAFAPIYNSSGEIVAIIGIDHPAPELGLIE